MKSLGIVKERWKGVTLQESNKSYQEILKFIRSNLNEVGFYYSVLKLFEIRYCFTKTDAVYFWTKRRYNIARYRDFYPIFEQYCKKLNLKVDSKKGVFYSPEILKEFKSIKKEDYLIEPLDETIKFMNKNIYNFQPALEMIDEMYKKGLKVKYREANTLRES